MKRNVVRLLATLGLGAAVFVSSTSSAEAAMISFGSTLVKSGNFVPVDATGAETTLDQAVGFDFTTLVAGDTATPGTAGQFIVTTATGDFGTAGLLFSIGSITDFMFNSSAIVGFPTVPVASFEVVGSTFSFDLDTLSIDQQTSNFLNLVGTGTFYLNGYDPTPGTITLTGTTTTGLTFGFTANQAVAAPEPTVMGLFGLALFGLGGAVRRRFNS